MQVFNWQRLYPLANDLIKNSDEAHVRTGTNRYYYASYNLVRKYLIETNRLDPNLKVNVHQKVLNSLRKSNYEMDRQLHDNLVVLRHARTLADNDDAEENSIKLIENINSYKKKAECIIRILDNIYN